MKVGYCRVSSESQNIDSQIDALNKYGVDKLYQEKISGVAKERPALAEMMDYIRPGDIVVVTKLDRLGRSMNDLINLVEGFKEKGIGFVSLAENIDTSTTTGKLIFHIFASLAEFERDLIRERTEAGRASARARGRMGGRPRKEANTALMLYDARELTPAKICELCKISQATLYRWVKERKDTQAKEAKAQKII